jgi:catechol 2,3-dioxygenase-like lactoylglutathione lyase family enzyme
MFSHVTLGANDYDEAKAFYDATLGALGHGAGAFDERGRLYYATPKGMLLITRPINGEPASCANGGTIGFLAETPENADAWHAAGLAHGGTTCEDPPGERVGSGFYLAYLRDPSGNKLCALHQLAS